MEVLDLELAHFVEYRPETTFSAKEFVVTEVPRDRVWFKTNAPCMQAFCDELESTPEEVIHEIFRVDSRKRSVDIDIDMGDCNSKKCVSWLGLPI